MSDNIEETRMPLTSPDMIQERVEWLKDTFPEAFTEGEIDFSRLRQALGDLASEGRERYGLSWAGKADAIRAIQTPSTGTLVPCPEESINFETTENMFIEGDNLEVLKLLQKSYYGKVKMIYIDPPYNTGNEFIYPDNFREGLEDYLKYSGQVSTGGVKLSTNTETSGRYHSAWLNMMYPRLFLARNLLKEDGVIFVSIDDNEVHNLRLLMDEIFGSENFIASIVWHKMDSPKNSAVHLSVDHDYILLYARDAAIWRPHGLPRSEEMLARYRNPDNDPRGPWLLGDLAARNFYAQGRYPITTPSGRVIEGPPPGSYWRVNSQKFEELNKDNRIWWGEAGDNRPGLKRFLSEVREGVVPQTYWPWKDVGSTRHAKRELLTVLNAQSGQDLFITPKPSALMKRMLQIATNKDGGDLVLDFFAGSASTGHSVYQQNIDDGGDRRFILVQLPEPLPNPVDTMKSIFDVGLERLRNVASNIVEDEKNKLEGFARKDVVHGLGCRVLRLKSSNFKAWNPDHVDDPKVLAGQLKLFADHVHPDRSQQDILYELLLKAGLPLTASVEQLSMANQTVYSIAEGLLLICLADEVTQDMLRGMIELAPQRIICLDSAFKGNDQLKTNTVLEMKSHGIEFRTV